MKLTSTQCRNAEPGSKAYGLSDGAGLRLLVQPSGKKLWQMIYRFDGRQRTLSIGEFPLFSLKDARDARDAARKQLAFGIDPLADKQDDDSAAVDVTTFRAIAEEHHEVWKVGKNKAHIDRVWRRLERDALKAIGDRAINEITPQEILEMIRAVEGRGAIDISKRLKQKCSEVFCYAIATGRATVDPTASITKALKPRPRVQHMGMVGGKGIPDLVKAIRGYAGEPETRDALLFTLLTATRTSEVRFATWVEIEDDLWRIPKHRMKMNREHLVPLSKQAREILEAVKERSGGAGYIFHGQRPGKAMSENTMIYGLYRIGFHSRQTVHGFRRLFSTVLNENEFNRDWVEMQLAHSDDDDVRGAYNAAQYLRQRATMMQWWADHLMPSETVHGDDFEALLG